MELHLPRQLLAQFEAERDTLLRGHAMEAVDRLQAAIDDAVPRLAEVANPQGGRVMTAAAFMMRANDLLREARGVEDRPMACVLSLRSVLELAVVGRYLICGPDAEDEFARRLNDAIKKESGLAARIGAASAGPPDFLLPLIDPNARPPRSMPALAEQLDAIDDRTAGQPGSVLFMYWFLHQYVSNSGSHANVLSIKNYAKREGDVLMLQPASKGVFETPPVLQAACMVYDLAKAVFEALGIPVDSLPTILSRPQSSEDGGSGTRS